MGKTVLRYRIALEFEVAKWKGFRKALQTAEDQTAFEELMGMCQNNAMASGNACNPVIFEPMVIVISILLAQQKKIRKLERRLHKIFWLRSNAQHGENGFVRHGQAAI